MTEQLLSTQLVSFITLINSLGTRFLLFWFFYTVGVLEQFGGIRGSSLLGT